MLQIYSIEIDFSSFLKICHCNTLQGLACLEQPTQLIIRHVRQQTDEK